MLSRALLILTIAVLTSAKTDLAGCVSSTTISSGVASILWYIPSSGEICQALDCGGGRAPPKTTVPGCPQYAGTATYSPSFLALATSASVAPSVTSSEVESAVITESPVTSDAFPTTSVGVASSSGVEQSTVIVTSPTLSLASTGTGSSNSTSTRVGGGSSSSTGSAPIVSATGNAASLASFDGLLGVAAAGVVMLF